MTSIFANVEMAPRDPILGITEAYNADNRKEKVNLGVGVYYDDGGKIPLLAAVKQAEKMRLASLLPRGYQPIEGPVTYNQAVQKLLFSATPEVVEEGRVLTIQALGGTGALKIGADYCRRLLPEASIYISDPSWENHRALFENAGFKVESYPYYDATTNGVNFEAMQAALKQLPANSIILLHACCHNPTGADLTIEQWQAVESICRERQLVPFLDMAYQGFGSGIVEDSAVLEIFIKGGLSFFISSSFSKNFSLYGERVGALSVVTKDKAEAARVLSQIKRVVRTNYSNPPTHGGALVTCVLNSQELRPLWENELQLMRQRILEMRLSLLKHIEENEGAPDFSLITRQRGMFSYTGLTVPQVERLRNEFAIYAVNTGRICLAALNRNNVKYVADAIATVVK